MKNKAFSLLTLALSGAALVVALISFNQKTPYTAPRETAFERVMRTGVIRCGYVLWPPAVMKDPNTGKFSGTIYDYVETLGKRLGVKIEWATEMSLATYLEDLNAGKFDVECSGGWPNALRGKVADYTNPIYYTPVFLYARQDDPRFDNDYASINNPDVRFATMVGEQSESYRAEVFPKSTEVSLLGTAPIADIMMQLLYKKADVVYNDEMSTVEFQNQHPGTVRRIQGPTLKAIPNNLSVAKGEAKLVSTLNIATEELINDGTIDRILQKYNLAPPLIYLVARPYQAP